MATQAQITFNAVAGTRTLPIGVLVQCNNNGVGGETTWFWQILDQPNGVVDSLSNPNIQNPTFTPKKEGSYFIKLTVNLGLADEKSDQRLVCVDYTVSPALRSPAAGETTEKNQTRGWAESTNQFEQHIASLETDSGVEVGVASVGGLSRGQILRIVSTTTINTGLPGERRLRNMGLALGTSTLDMGGPLFILEGGVDGSATPANGAAIKIRKHGLYLSALGTAALGDPVFAGDMGSPSLTRGSIRRRIGTVIDSSAGVYNFQFEGALLPSAGPQPILGFGNDSVPGGAGTFHFDPWFDSRQATVSSTVEFRMSRPGRLTRLSACCRSVGTGVGGETVITITRNGMLSTLSSSFTTGGAYEATDYTHTVDVYEGDRIGCVGVNNANVINGPNGIEITIELEDV